MKKSLKKSLYFGLAAVSVLAATSVATTNASAKSYAKVTSNKTLTTAATSRNVNLNGSNALYTKAGTLKGAKVVASTATAKSLSSSTNGAATFRAYQVATTNRGSVYYKVVSFDGQYRGWIYGGKSTTKFGGGISSYNTTKSATAPATTATYKLTDSAVSSSSNKAIYAQPAWAQYKVGRAKLNGSVIASTDAYKDTFFTFNDAATNRAGDLYYKVASASNESGLVGDWIPASAVTQSNAEPAATSDNSISVVYKTANGNQVGAASGKFIAAAGTNTKAGQAANDIKNTAGQTIDDFIKANLPAGYQLATGSYVGTTFGGTANVTVVAASTSKATLLSLDTPTSVGTTGLTAADFSNAPALTATQQADFTGNSSSLVSSGTLFKTLESAFGTNKYYLKATATGADGKPVYTYYTYDQSRTESDSANVAAKYGNNINLYFDKNTTTTAPAAADTSTNTNFLN
ncbi:hypothetical protein [Secundilactobacillus paracollinoides]|uniref:S-layer protein n=1 Tax=Secundilactobacillus paracollinoides TaxID=240427 RepID=A0A1B2IVG1_9LACO|nr:hypothetical protein [Secundilactobacillus paracollinoides]ANZ60217.1 hypothetical protein AYR61_01850 [Secundilactobacillus paracollinoides]ANZ66011.1 hypothetical protein AYR63_01870 [Secundilactobacillus paracollinoides]